MVRLFLILFSMIATTLMGIGIVIVLAMQMNAGWKPIALSALAGFVVSIPVTWLVARQILAKTGAGKRA